MIHLPVFTVDEFQMAAIERSDQAFVFEGLSHPQVIPFYGVSYRSYEATAAQMDFYEQLLSDGTGGWWKITDNSSGKMVGACGCNNFQHKHEKIEIGYWLLPDYWGKGIMRKVLPELLLQMTRIWKLHRVEAWVESGNDSSRRLLEYCGFNCEGLLRDTEIKNDKRISLYIYAKILD